MAYQLVRKRRFEKEFAALEVTLQRRVQEELTRISENPRAHGTKQLKGGQGHSSRVGDYRIIYDVDDAAQTVTLLTVWHRSSVYKR